MKRALIIAFLLTTPALAEPPQPPGPEQHDAAMSGEILECVSGKIGLRARIGQLEAELVKLKADAAKVPEPK